MFLQNKIFSGFYKKEKKHRAWQLDFLRGLAFIMMFIFHFVWDLRFFGIINFDIYKGFWGIFQIVTASLFIFVAGASLALSFSRDPKNFPKKTFFNSAKLSLMAFSVSFLTLILFPDNFIYFGILHFLAFCSFIFSILAGRPFTSLVLAVLILLLNFFYPISSIKNDYLFFLGFATPRSTFDLFTLIPWGSAFLFGIFLGNLTLKHNLLSFKEHENNLVSFICLLGKNSLVLYLLHQGFLFPLAWVISIL